MDVTEDEDSSNKSFAKNTTATNFIPGLMSQSTLEEETAESILDMHCSRIWSSSQHTPSRSPGRQSPFAKSPERAAGQNSGRSRKLQHSANVAAEVAAVASTMANTSFPRLHHRGKKDIAGALSRSFDNAGVVGETKETYRHIHYHHHHHHPRESGNKQRAIEDAPRDLSSSFWRTEPIGGDHRGRTNAKKAVGRKNSDSSSNIDSGISMVYETDSTHVIPPINWNDPSSEKYEVFTFLFSAHVSCSVPFLIYNQSL
jgi:hypothetical protein